MPNASAKLFTTSVWCLLSLEAFFLGVSPLVVAEVTRLATELLAGIAQRAIERAGVVKL